MKTTTNLTLLLARICNPCLARRSVFRCVEVKSKRPRLYFLRGTKQSLISPHSGGLRGASLLLFLFLSFASCSTDSDPHSARIYVRVSNECVCNLFLYTSEGLCLQSKIWDCSETTYLTFDVFQEGQFTIKAEYRNKTTSQTITAQLDKTYEIDIVF